MTTSSDFFLVKMTENDFSDHLSLVTNAHVMKWVTGKAMNEKEAKIKFEKILRANKIHPELGYFRIVHTADGDFVGVAKVEIATQEATEAEIGYLLMPKYWGKGIATEMASRLIILAKQMNQIQSLFGIIDPENIASRKVLLNHHFVHESFDVFDGLPGERLSLTLK